MPNYIYHALNEANEAETGRISAANAAEAVALLEARGLVVQMIRQGDATEQYEEPVANAEDEEVVFHNRIEEIRANRRTLAPALAAFAEELPRGRSRRDLARFANRLSGGASVEELAKSPGVTATWIPLVSGGSALGSATFLRSLFAEASRDSAMRAQRVRVFAYPFVVLCLALTVLFLLCLIVVPTFVDIYDDFEMILPGMTRLLVNLARELRSNPLRVAAVVAVLIAIGYGIYYVLTTANPIGALFASFTRGSSRQVMAMASFERRLADALRTGLPLPSALRLAARGSNRWLNRQADALAAGIEHTGGPPKSSKLPPSLLFALRAGSEGTPNIALVEELSEMYAERVQARFDWSSGFVPQFAIFVVGLIVGFVVMALYLPLVQLINGLTG